MTMYNVERFLREAIESILSQTYSDYEYIIVDDGSTDNSFAIAESYHDQRIHLFRSPHVGRAAALNKAIGYSRTDLLAFMDADDISKSTRFEEQMRFLSENPFIGVVGSWAERVDENRKYIRIIKYPEYHTQIEYRMTAIRSLLFPGSIIRKKLIIHVNGFDESIVASSDSELMRRLLPITQFHNIPKPLYVYRKNRSSISFRLNDLQKNTQLKKGKEYLMTVYDKQSAILYRRIGICEYYNGSMHTAKMYLFKALCLGDLSYKNVRYFFPSFLGDKLFSLYRRELKKRF